MDPTIDYTKAYYELGNDIDMSGVNDWTPIGTGLDNEKGTIRKQKIPSSATKMWKPI